MHEGKYYSQSNEEKYILEFFGNKKGTLLEIGAYNPEAFSNSRRLILNGWQAVLVEADPICYKNILSFYEDNKNVVVVPTAIGSYDGELDFYSNQGAVATAVEEHYNKWKTVDANFKKIKIPVVTWHTFCMTYLQTFDFISIDTEGMDWEIVSQIDLDETKTKLICIEYTYYGQEIYNYIRGYGFNLIHQNGENIIMGR